MVASAGSETIEATITSVCGAAITITSEILVGGLELNQVLITESAPPCPNGYVEYEAIVPGTASDYDFTWRIPAGVVIYFTVHAKQDRAHCSKHRWCRWPLICGH